MSGSSSGSHGGGGGCHVVPCACGPAPRPPVALDPPQGGDRRAHILHCNDAGCGSFFEPPGSQVGIAAAAGRDVNVVIGVGWLGHRRCASFEQGCEVSTNYSHTPPFLNAYGRSTGGGL